LFKVKSKDYEFVVDTNGSGVTPPDAFLASLGTCIGVYLRKYAQGVKLDLPEFSISVDADFSQERPVCFRKINVKVDLKNCPVHNTLKFNPEVTITVR
jgi:uncharacterized OsmC-like protein